MPIRQPQTEIAQSQPDAAEVRAQLARVLGSRVFESAGRASEFLRFVVEETLAGRGDRVKGFTIAVAVFGRQQDFDAQADPLVRVEAGRLRRRLLDYYHGEGRDDAIRIELPRGGYAPRFVYAAPVRTGSPEWRARLGHLRRPAVVTLVVGIAAIAVALLFAWPFDRTAPSTDVAARSATAARSSAPVTAGGPRLLVLPFTNLSGDRNVDSFVGGLTEEIIAALVGFNIFATVSPAATALESTSLQSLRTEFDVGYALAGSARTEGGRMRVSARLIETQAGTQLWARTFDEELSSANALEVQVRIAATVAKVLSSPYGPVYAQEIVRTADKNATDLDPYECLLRFYAYVRSFNPAGHAQSVGCLQRAVLSEPRFAPAWAGLAVLYLHEHIFGYTPQPDRGPALARALEAARTALDIDGSGRVSAIAMVGVQRAAGDEVGFERAVERALAIRPIHPAVLAQVGYILTVSGDWRRGLPLVEEAIPVTGDVPGWFYTAYALRYLQTQDYEQALEWALKVDAPDWFVAPMTAAASAALAGRTDIAQREVTRLLELYPDFPTTGRQQLAKWNMNDALFTTLLDGLRLAGLPMS